MAQMPMLRYVYEVLEEHTIVIEDMNTNMVEAIWLIRMVNEMSKVYKVDDSQ